MSATVVLIERAGAMHKDLYEAEESCADDDGTGLLNCTLLFARQHAIRIACILLLVVQVVQRIQMILFHCPEFMTSTEQMRPFMQPGDMYDLRL